MKRSTPKFLAVLSLGFTLVVPQIGNPCGPLFPNAVFTFQRHPDAPLKRYAQGELGVILPSFARSYLVVAYRQLSGKPLLPSETNGMLKYWHWKLRGGWDRDLKDPNEEWLAARERVLGKQDSAPPLPYKVVPSSGEYVTIGEFQNCGPESFQTATQTLNDRIRRFGRHSSAVREWLSGQDAVFSNCGRTGLVPALLVDNASSRAKADRQYQVAAAHFYAGAHLKAAQEFDAIAQDKHSSWGSVAPYLAARSMVRHASLDQSSESLNAAEVRLKTILRDKSQTKLHRAARRLLTYIAFRRDPVKRTHELGRLLAKRRLDPEFEQSVIDYTVGLDRALGSSPDFWEKDDTPARVRAKEERWKDKRYQELRAFVAGDEMTDWVLTFQQEGRHAANHAASRWQKQQSLPWLVAAIAKLNPSDGMAPQIAQAAAHISATSPAYPTVMFHRIRLLMEAGEDEKARNLVEDFLREFSGKLPLSSLNLFLAQRLRLTTSFDDFVVHAARPSVGNDSWGDDVGDAWLNCGWDENGCDALVFGPKKNAEPDRRLDRTAALTFNLRMPLDLLQQAVLGSHLPEHLRGELAVSTWTRAVILGKYEIADAVLPVAQASYPQMTKDLEAYAGSAGSANKWHAALFAILHFPGMRPYVNARSARATPMAKIDSYRDNWWCDDVGAVVEEPNYTKDYAEQKHQNLVDPPDAPSYPLFLTTEQIANARSEWATIKHKGGSGAYLPGEVLKWARENPGDPRIPEALHYAVRATRYGCGGSEESSTLSRQAFRLLHGRYPDSRWAKQTPYWF